MVLYPTNLLYKLPALWLNYKAELIDVVLQHFCSARFRWLRA